MKKKLVLPLLLILAAAALGITACKDGQTAEWKDVSAVYGTQGFVCEPDEGMTVDGYLDEEEWDGRAVFEHTEAEVTIRMKAFYTVKGMYFGMSSRDYHIVYFKPYGMYNNYNTGFVLSAAAEGDVKLINRFSVGFDAGNTPRAFGLYNYRARATVQGGGVNTGNSDGMTVEAFVPWENIGLNVRSEDELPANIRVALRYNVVPSEGSSGTNIYPGLSNDTNYAKFYKFDRNGYADADKEEYLLGDGADGYAKSAEFDFSRADEGIYGSHRPADRTAMPNMKNIFVRNAYADSFSFTVKIKPSLVGGTAVIGNETNPGVYLFGQTNYGLSGFGVDLGRDAVGRNLVRLNTVGYFSRRWTRPPASQAIFAQKTVYNVSDGVPLTLIKDGDTYYYVLGTPEDGTYIGYEKNVIHSGAACPGILSSNAAALYSDIRFQAYGSDAEGRAAVSALLEGLGICRVTAEVTGPGRAVLSTDVVPAGGSAVLSFLPSNGRYALTGFTVTSGGTQTDRLAELKAGADGGTFALTDLAGDTAVRLTYGETEYKTMTFAFDTGGARYSQLLLTAEHVSDKSKYYEYRTSGPTLPAALPAGRYNVTITAGGFVTHRQTIDVTADGERTVTLEKAAFGGTVEVNGKTLNSSAVWDTSLNDANIAVRPMTAPSNDTVWMAVPANGDFTLSVSFTVTDATDPDPNGGFMLSDGRQNYGVFLLNNGVRVLDGSGSKGGWQDRSFGDFANGIGGSLKGKTVSLRLTRVNGAYTFTAECGAVRFTRKLEGLTYTWYGDGSKLDLPAGQVALGLAASTGSAITYADISFVTNG